MSYVPKKVVVAYSGGLDTSIMLTWFKEQYGCEVIALTADVGQADELDGLEEKALATGADKFEIADLKEPFVRDFVYMAVKTHAVYEGVYLLGTSLARPLIGKALVDAAERHGADAIAHGATGKGNDQVRFELAAYACQPEIRILAPWRGLWDFRSREDLMAYAAKHGIPVGSTAAKPYSMDRNLMHISYEGGILEDPWNAPPEDMFLLTQSPSAAPDVHRDVVIDFVAGNPVAVDGKAMGPVELLTHLNEIAGENGVGRVDLVENRYVGIKSRGVYETPGGTILHEAHRGVESLTMDREVLRIRDSLLPRFTEIIYNGYWYSPEGEAMVALMNELQKDVTGSARVRLFKGRCWLTGRRAQNSLYSEEHATFGPDEVYEQRDAEGFIKLNALRLKLHTYRKQGRLAQPGQLDVGSLRDGYIE